MLSPQEAARELLHRRAARTSLIDFSRYTLSTYEEAGHHRLIADKLEAVERGDCKRLMIFMPPRHGKSELASRRFPAWYMGRNPTVEIIAASYNSDLAADFGREVRSIVNSTEYQALFPGVGLRQDSKAADRWHTTGGGAYRASGVGTAMTGRGADLLLIDDPVKDREEADSELRRDRVWDWYRSTAYTRLSPQGRVVVIQTRWHEDDLSGRLLEAMEADGDQWDVLSLPAIIEGRALWEDRFPIERLDAIKRTVGAREWSALYMQSPQPDEGTYFQRDWLKSWDTKPEDLRIYGTSDYAVTDGGGDYTVHRIWGVCPKGGIYRLDGWRGQTSSDVWIERQIDLIKKHKPFAWFGEAGVIQKAIEPMLIRRMRERETRCRMEWLPSIADKPTRARGFQSRAAMGEVWFEPGADVSEFLVFPAGKHDDDVDNGSLIGRALDMAHPAIVRAEVNPRDKPRTDYQSSRDRGGSEWMEA